MAGTQGRHAEGALSEDRRHQAFNTNRRSLRELAWYASTSHYIKCYLDVSYTDI